MKRQQASGQLEIRPINFAGTIPAITDHRVPQPGQVTTNLVLAAGLDAHFHERSFAAVTDLLQ